MPDEGHIATDKLLAKLEKKIGSVYDQASKEMQAKLDKKLKSYSENLVKMQNAVNSGQITPKDFDTWKKNQAHIISNMKSVSDALADDLVNSDKIAASLINGHTPEVYALNYNFGTYQIESGIDASTSFALYDQYTVERLLKDDPNLLPHVDIDPTKDKPWNKRHISNSISQGILQGESIPKIAKRLQTTVGMDRNAAVRNARTATTGAQNAGRVSSYERAIGMGIDMRQEWLATVDSRTRRSHVALDGEVVEVGKMFSNKCHYPGDPAGPGREVYNCRCTLLPVIKGFEDSEDWKQGSVKGLSYREWRAMHDIGDKDIISHFKNSSMSSMLSSIKVIDKSDSTKIYKLFQEKGKNYNLKPANIWEKYLNGTLGGNDIKDIDNILKKYKTVELKKSTKGIKKAVDVINPLDEWKNVDLYDSKVSVDAFNHIINKSFDKNLDMKEYWKLYTSGKITDPELDKLLGLKIKATKVVDDVATKVAKSKKKLVNHIENTDDWLNAIKDGPSVEYMLAKEDTIWKVSQDAEKAFEMYSGSSYIEMNEYLRLIDRGMSEADAITNSGITTSQLKALKTLQKEFKKLKLDQTYYLRRGSDLGDIAGAFMSGDFNDNVRKLQSKSIDEINQMFVGKVGNMASFTSTSSQWDRGFTDDLEIIFKAPKGTRGSSIMNISEYGTEEGETLLGDNTIVRFVKMEKSDGHKGSKYRLFLKIIPN